MVGTSGIKKASAPSNFLGSWLTASLSYNIHCFNMTKATHSSHIWHKRLSSPGFGWLTCTSILKRHNDIFIAGVSTCCIHYTGAQMRTFYIRFRLEKRHFGLGRSRDKMASVLGRACASIFRRMSTPRPSVRLLARQVHLQ